MEVLMSTMNCKDINEFNLKKYNIKNAKLTVINQLDSLETKKYNEKNTVMYNFNEVGLSKSRNRAIEVSSEEICLIADNDVIYKDNTFKIIQEIFEKNTDADIITFQIETPDGKLFKKYPVKEFWHNKKSILKVSSPDIVFRKKSLEKSKVKFDENFGLGAKYNTGEQNIFLLDCLNQGLKIKYIPIPIVIHPYENSGRIFNKQQFVSKGAVFFRMFGIKAFILNIIFAFKKYDEYKGVFNRAKAIHLMNMGTIEYIRLRRKS